MFEILFSRANESSFTKADKELKKNSDVELDSTIIEFNEIRITKRKAEYLYPVKLTYP